MTLLPALPPLPDNAAPAVRALAALYERMVQDYEATSKLPTRNMTEADRAKAHWRRAFLAEMMTWVMQAQREAMEGETVRSLETSPS